MTTLISVPQVKLFGAGLAAAVLLSASVSAQVVHYEWTGSTNNSWNNAENWNPNDIYPGRSGAGNESYRRHSATVSGATVNSTVQILFDAPYDADYTGTFYAVRLINGATFNTASAFRVRSVQDTTRNMLIDATSSFISTVVTNGFQPDGTHSTVTTVTVQGLLDVVSITNAGLPAPTFDGTPGGFIIDVDGGTVISTRTNFHNQSSVHSEAIGQFHIKNGGSVSLGEIVRIGTSSNFYIDFVDGTGSLTFSTAGYQTLAAVEGLIGNGKIRIGGSVVDATDFTIQSIEDGWQVGVIPEPSTYALLAGFAALAGAAFVKRRRKAETGQ